MDRWLNGRRDLVQVIRFGAQRADLPGELGYAGGTVAQADEIQISRRRPGQQSTCECRGRVQIVSKTRSGRELGLGGLETDHVECNGRAVGSGWCTNGIVVRRGLRRRVERDMDD